MAGEVVSVPVSLPSVLDAERALVGAALLGADPPDVSPEDFGHLWLGRTWRAILDLHASGRGVDPVTVAEESGTDKGELIVCMNGALSHNAPSYARVVLDASRRRRVVTECLRIAGMAAKNDADVLEQELARAAMGSVRAADAVTAAEANARLLSQAETGIPHLPVPGLPGVFAFEGDVVVLAMASGAGKTSIVSWWADVWSSEHSRPVLVFEAEMTPEQLWSRIASRQSGVSMPEVVGGADPGSLERMRRVEPRDVSIVSGRLHIDRILLEARRFARRTGGRGVVVIDHLSRVVYSNPGRLNRADAIGVEVTNRLKDCAVETGLVVVEVSQLTKSSQRIRDRRTPWPEVDDIRDSGHIINDASLIVMGHRWDDAEEGVKVRQRLGVDPLDPRALIRLHVGKGRWHTGKASHLLADLRTNEFEEV